MAYWYNVVSGQVESDEDRSQGDDVMGPYDTAEEAARALEIAAEKTAAWDAEDAEWDKKGTSTQESAD